MPVPENAEMFTDTHFLAYSREHLWYEIDMLLQVYELSGKKFPDELKTVLTNILIESYTIHFRNLVTFLYPTKNVRPSDVYAYHFYTPKTDWQKIAPVISPTLEKARGRAHREIGHLTTKRHFGTPQEKHWNFTELLIELVLVLKVFSDSADPSKLDVAVKNLIDTTYRQLCALRPNNQS
jgi:hypothetical protein